MPNVDTTAVIGSPLVGIGVNQYDYIAHRH